MKLKSVVLLAVAVACGLVAMLGVQQALSTRNEQVDLAQVLVATTDIAPGTRLDETNTAFKRMSKESIPEGAVTKAEEYVDRALRGGAVPGEMIMLAKLGEKGVFGASGEIPKGMRVVTVPVNSTTTHSGLIRPGDRVDILLTYDSRIQGVGMEKKTRTVLEYIKVFATDSLIAGQQTAQGTNEINAKNISLLLYPDQAQLLMTAKREGELHLALRHKNDGPLDESGQERPHISQEQRAKQKEEFAQMMNAALDWIREAADAVTGGQHGDVVPVLVAVQDILPGTRLDETNTAFKEMPKSAIPDDVVTSPEQFEDRALLRGAVAGEMILATRLGEKGIFGASAEIPRGMRVVTVPVDATKTHSGRLRPGDRVDVLLTYKFETPAEPVRYQSNTSFAAAPGRPGADCRARAAVSAAADAKSDSPQTVEKSETVQVPQTRQMTKTKAVLECIEVFAADGFLEGEKAKSGENVRSSAANVSLLVDPDQANLLTQAASMGTLHLAMRHGLDCEPARAIAVDERMLDAAPVNVARTCDVRTQPVAETAPEAASDCTWRVMIRSGAGVRVQNFRLPAEECPEPAI